MRNYNFIIQLWISKHGTKMCRYVDVTTLAGVVIAWTATAIALHRSTLKHTQNSEDLHYWQNTSRRAKLSGVWSCSNQILSILKFIFHFCFGQNGYGTICGQLLETWTYSVPNH